MTVTRNVVKKFGAKVASGVALVTVGIGSAMAAVPTEVTTALGDLKTDSTTVASLAFAAFLAVLAFAYMKRAAR